MNLVLGQGHNYDRIDKNGPICLPIPRNEWKIKKENGKLLYIDNDEKCDPDIVLDIETSWIFFPDKYTDTIIDTTGLGLSVFTQIFWDEIYRVLKPGGCMFTKNELKYFETDSGNKWEKFEKEQINESVIKFSKPEM